MSAAIIDAVGNLHDSTNGQFAGRVLNEADPDLLANPGPAAEPQEQQPAYMVPSWGKVIAEERIEKANRRLARAGIEERFEAIWGEPEIRTETDPDGREHHYEYLPLTLNHPKICYDGWTFVASLDETENGMIVNTVPDVELDGYRPETAWCEHCGTRRQRAKTFLVQHEDGTLMQVGSTCIKDFLGVQPSGLWTIGYDPLEDADEEWGSAGSGGSFSQALVDTRMMVAAALVASDMGRDYKPSSFGTGSTKDAVSDILWGRGGSLEVQAARRAAYTRAKELVQSGKADEVVAAAAELDGDGDYAINMRTFMANPLNRTKHVGFIASSVKVWAKQQEIKVRQSMPKAQGHIAPVGAKLADLRTADGRKGVEVTVERTFVNEFYVGYNTTSYSTRLIMRTADGHTVVWKASGLHDLNAGDRILLTGGTVKEHGAYEGIDQTVITRAKYEPLAPADEAQG